MKKCPALRRLAQDNKGSAILTVVISMMFVVALGTALLFAAYMGLQVSVSARNEKDNFYDASAAMDEVKILIQDQVSTALKTAYTEALVAYAKLQTTNPQDTLYTNFLSELGNQKKNIFDYTYNNVSKTTTITVDINELKAVLPENATLTAKDIDSNYKVNAEVSEDSVTIKGLELVYIDTDGYESRIATDLVVEIPNFFTGASDAGGVGNYAIIAKTGFTSGGIGAAIKEGGIFAGPSGIATTGNGDILSVSGGRVITSGTVTAKMDSKINLGPEDKGTVNYDIWAQEIVSEKGSTVTVNGNTYVADDLVLNSGSKVTLKGQYYGFGSDDAETGRDDSESSSIFVNSYVANETDADGNPLRRKNAALNIEDLDQLSLAGISFIGTVDVPTGQSLSAKSDQLAYLIPAEALTNYKTNPCVAEQEAGVYVQPAVNTAAVLWTIDGVNKTLAYYLADSNVTDNNYSGDKGSILAYFSQDGVGYFFINFTDQAMANEYFKDYFTAKPDAIKQYLDLYLDMTGNSRITVTKGNTYEKLSGTWQNILGNSVFPDTQADYLASRYVSLSASPMGLYVDTEKLEQSLGEKQFKIGNDVVAIVAHGNCTYSGGAVKVIIATGNVTVNADFTGIIIAGGTVTLNNKTVTYVKPTEEILASVCETTTERLSDYLNAGMFSDDQTDKVNEWSPDKLVYYSNWQKN